MPLEQALPEPIPYSAEMILDKGRTVLTQEAGALERTAERLGEPFVAAVRKLLACRGRAVVSGIGKSAIIAQKIVATFNSTGQPSVFLHAADAIHGDLGMVQAEDLVILLSHSGNTPEIKVLIPLVRRLGAGVIAMTGNLESELAQRADIVLDSSVLSEACPHNLAPTTSTTVSLALGDALAVCLLEGRGFRAEDFAAYHPGGALGKRMYLKVSDIYPGNSFPTVVPETPLGEVILQMTGGRLGAAAVLNPTGGLAGIVTDGDLRRMLGRPASEIIRVRAEDIMTRNPRTIDADESAAAALALMQERNITQLVVMQDSRPVGFIHLHDLLKEGLV